MVRLQMLESLREFGRIHVLDGLLFCVGTKFVKLPTEIIKAELKNGLYFIDNGLNNTSLMVEFDL